MLASLSLLLGLPLALAAESPSCAPLVPVTFDNATIPRVSAALSRDARPHLSYRLHEQLRVWEEVMNPVGS